MSKTATSDDIICYYEVLQSLTLNVTSLLVQDRDEWRSLIYQTQNINILLDLAQRP